MNPFKLALGGAVVALLLIIGLNSYTTVPRGHVGSITLFGKVDPVELPSGFHFVNPLANIEDVKVQNSEHTFDGVDVPSQDKLLTDVDVTVKWRIDPAMASESLRDTGDKNSLVSTHLVPKARSVIRETGKTIAKADDFFQEEVQAQMQSAIYEGLTESLATKGIIIEEVLIRGIRLPKSVADGVTETKRREIEGQKQIAELERFRTEQQQKVAFAKAEAEAAEQQLIKRSTLADAKYYEITKDAQARAEAIKIEGEALRNNPDLIKLRKIERWDGVMPKYLMSGDSSGGVSMLFDAK